MVSEHCCTTPRKMSTCRANKRHYSNDGRKESQQSRKSTLYHDNRLYPVSHKTVDRTASMEHECGHYTRPLPLYTVHPIVFSVIVVDGTLCILVFCVADNCCCAASLPNLTLIIQEHFQGARKSTIFRPCLMRKDKMIYLFHLTCFISYVHHVHS
jgi:hypothetical protein